MVIFYNIETNEIIYTENKVTHPSLPIVDVDNILLKQGLSYVCLNNEMGLEVFNYKVSFDEEGNFKGLKLKEVI